MTSLGILIAIVALGQATPETGATHQDVREGVTIFAAGSGLPGRTPDGESIDAIRAIAVNTDGSVIASATSSLTNILLLEYRDGAWRCLLPFIDYVTKTQQSLYVASCSGRTYGPGGSPGDAKEEYRNTAAAVTPDGHQLAGNGRGVLEELPSERKYVFSPNEPILALAAGPGGAVAVGTESSLSIRAKAGAEFARALPKDARYTWSPKKVRALAYDTKGRLWLGCSEGAGVWDGKAWALFTTKEGLPGTRFTCAAPGENGVIWFGTEAGAMRFDGTHWTLRVGPEWLHDDLVSSIAVEAGGTVWIATQRGVSRLSPNAH